MAHTRVLRRTRSMSMNSRVAILASSRMCAAHPQRTVARAQLLRLLRFVSAGWVTGTHVGWRVHSDVRSAGARPGVPPAQSRRSARRRALVPIPLRAACSLRARTSSTSLFTDVSGLLAPRLPQRHRIDHGADAERSSRKVDTTLIMRGVGPLAVFRCYGPCSAR